LALSATGSVKTMLSLALMGLLPPGAARFKWHDRKAANGACRSRLAHRSGTRNRRDLSGAHDLATSLNPLMRIDPQIEEAIVAHEPAAPYTREPLAAVPEIPRPAKV
jgi:ABC-type glutathione transport system ATPase component